ncbi:hypothetical protein [Bailinhaonella thermotolerans]|uniref:Uncharacterized protein n=1 Tax=Bailinhaonella thermotolerans TaxID=1070861 RepID=A0A3A4B0D0_9ACTN|nr:hypothetical protein [Bailinhaonella thermotolerans]RJL33388.1 hypothetical protein D5H75_11395 [Bailinhaonella thermotolerans]
MIVPLALADPLGNFTVNHHNGLRLSPGRVANLAVVDAAELPTLQEQAEVAARGPRAHAVRRCAELAAAQTVRVDGRALRWRVGAASFAYAPGQGGLRTSRLTCVLSAPAALARPGSVVFADAYLADRPGWQEITRWATGYGSRAPPCPP